MTKHWIRSGLARVLLFLTALALLNAAVASSAAADLQPGLYEIELVSSGLVRTYDVYVPSSYDGQTAVPLVVDFHGFTDGFDFQRLLSGWQEKAEDEGFIAAWPQGLGIIPGWNAETCCGEAVLWNIDDVGFARDLVADLSQRGSIDAARVYATGLSNGGALSHYLGCHAADVFAAVAPVSYMLPVLFESTCNPSRPMPVMHFHGRYDPIVPYYTGLPPTFRSAPESHDAWADINSCTDWWPSTTFYQLGSYCTTYDRCDGDAEVTLCNIRGEHTLYNNLSFIEIPDLAWEFFEAHPLD